MIEKTSAKLRSVPVPFIVLMVVIAVFQLATIRSGHAWGDDWAMYIAHARAIVEGAPYDGTGYIYDPATSWYSPRVYPPGFPLLLVPVYALFGFNFLAMKIVVVVFLLATIAMFAVLMRPFLPPSYVLVVTALLGFQPYLTAFKDHVLPDIPFIFFVLLSLHLIRRLDIPREKLKDRIIAGAVAGAVACFAMSVRTIGITLFGAFVLAEILRLKRPRIEAVSFLAMAGLLYFLQHSMVPAGSGYSSQVADVVTNAPPPADLLPNFHKFSLIMWETYRLWNGPWIPLRNFVGVIILALSGAGYAVRLRRSPSVIEAYVLAYCCAVFLFPALDLRYLLPVAPFLLYYPAVALAEAERRNLKFVTPFAGALAVTVAVFYSLTLSRAKYGPIDDGATTRTAMQMYAAVAKCTAPTDRVLFHKARALALYTRHPTMVTPFRYVDVVKFMENRGIRYAVASRREHADSVLGRLPSFAPVFRNDSFTLYEAGGTSPRRCP